MCETFKEDLASRRSIPEDVKNVISHSAKLGHPMSTLRTAVSMLGSLNPKEFEVTVENNYDIALSLTSQIPTIVAATQRARKDEPILDPDPSLGLSEDFLRMMTGEMPESRTAEVMDMALIMHAEHGMNASTFSAMVTNSSLTDLYSSIIAGIGSLKGPLHGGANEEVMHMMNKIKKPENALKWINNALKNKEVVMGFGHRVYKSGDSRVPTMRKYFGKVAKLKKDKKFEKIYDIVEKVMIKEKNIHPNVDYPTGPTYHLMGFDTDFFTPIFVISRITGWSAHIMEQHAANKLIRPLASYKGNKHRKVLQLNQR